METHDDQDTGLPWLAILVIGGLAILGLITIIQWALGAILGFIKLVVFIGVVIAIGAALVNALSRR